MQGSSDAQRRVLRSAARVRTLSGHVCQAPAATEKVDINAPGYLGSDVRTKLLDHFDEIKSDLTDLDLPGPIASGDADVKAVLEEIGVAGAEGLNHLVFTEMQRRFCKGSMSGNFVIPYISFTRDNAQPPRLTNLVVLAHPADCQRIARSHVKKIPDQAIFLGQGILSTTDNESWRDQRSHITEAFLPINSMATRVFPVSLSRSEVAVERFRLMIDEPAIDLHEVRFRWPCFPLYRSHSCLIACLCQYPPFATLPVTVCCLSSVPKL
jgi:hypothetical protein